MSYYVHPTAILDKNVSVGEGTRIWHFVHVMSGAKIGRNSILGQNVFVGKNAVIGNGVKIQNNVSVYESVELEDEVFVGPSVVFTNVKYPRAFIEQKHNYLKTLVRKGATIGANATIVCGIELGEYCFIGAGSVVIRDVPAYALMVGNPARQIGWVSKAGRPLSFDSNGIALCDFSGKKYRLRENKLEEL